MLLEHFETPIANPRIKVSYLSFKFEKYNFLEENGILYLCGKNPEPKELFKKETTDSYNILLELITLHRDLEVSTFISPFKFGINKISHAILNSEHDLERILKFVKKHGFPYFNKAADYNIFYNNIPTEGNTLGTAKKNILYDVSPFCDDGKFNVSLFVYILHQILIQDFIRIVAYHGLKDYLNIFLTNKDKKQITFFEKHMNNLSLQSPDYNTFITYWNNESMALEVRTENIMHLSSYYLCLMASSGGIEGYVRQCKGCGMLFVTDNPRLRYCQNPCTRQNIHMRKMRQKRNP